MLSTWKNTSLPAWRYIAFVDPAIVDTDISIVKHYKR